MEWSWFPLRELLKNRLDMLLGLDLLVRQALVAGGLDLLATSLHFLELVCFNVIKINELSLIMLQEELHRSRTIASSLSARVSSNPNNPNSTETSEALVLELFRDRPRDQISRWTKTPLEMLRDRILIN